MSARTSTFWIFHLPFRAYELKYGSSKVATAINRFRARKAFAGNSRLMHGMWMINWIPLIIPHIWDKLAFNNVVIMADPKATAATAA
jgi:hypothetical protein